MTMPKVNDRSAQAKLRALGKEAKKKANDSAAGS
jgi:hypothetical protein